MNNHNNWGAQPPRQAYNGMPQVPPQQVYQQQQHQQHQQHQQQYGGVHPNGNAMAFVGNQQYQANGQFMPPRNHQMQSMPPMPPMPHYAQQQPVSQQHVLPHAQHQLYHASSFNAHQQQPAQQQQQQPHAQQHQHFSNGAYSHHAAAAPNQYMNHQNYSQPHQPFPQAQQQAATPSPRQMQQALPPARPPHMAHSQPPPQQPQPMSRPPSRPLQLAPQTERPHMPSPSPQLQHRSPTHIDPSHFQQHQPYVQSPLLQQRAPEALHPSQFQAAQQSHVASPTTQPRAADITNRNQFQQSQPHAPSPQAQQRVTESINPEQLQQRYPHGQSPQVQQRIIEPAYSNQIHKDQSQVPPPHTQHQAPSSIDPSQLFQSAPQMARPQPQPQPRPEQQPKIQPPPQHEVPQSHATPVPSFDAIDPSQLFQPPSHVAHKEIQQPASDAIDPSKIQQGQRAGPAAQPQRSGADVIDPSQLMLSTQTPPLARKSISSATSATRSPSVSHAHSPAQHFDTPAVLTCVANDCFKVAHSAVHDVAMELDQRSMDEYYKLIATGLGCLEAALALNKLPPRAEANVRLRYATILSEETDNLREAEVALTKGIAVCEKSRLTDLKYCMQFQLLKVLYRRNRKAALVALDKNISEATTYKAVDWVYAYRFLRASFHLQSGSPADTHAMDNLRNISSLAAHRGDAAIAVLTSLLEGMIHLKSRKDDSIVRVQHCIAQAARYQHDPSVHIPQIDVLTLLLDLACSLQQKAPKVAMQKLKSLQMRMDELVQTSDWDTFRDELLLPLKKQSNSTTSVTDDTKTIIRPGDEHNFIVMSFVTKIYAFVLAYVLSGLALLYHGSRNEKIMEYWMEALNMLSKSNEHVRPPAYSLPMAIEQARWRAEVGCYIHTLVALISATRTQWWRVKDSIEKIDALKPKPENERLSLLVLYVRGVYYQGTGDLESASQILSDPRFDIADSNDMPAGGVSPAPPEVSLLAALNRIWIMQEPSRRDDQQTSELLERVRPYCVDHADVDIRTAFNLGVAAIETYPSQSMQTVKRHISTGLKFAQQANNTQLLGVALNLMRACLFDSVVGDQAVKSAKAGRTQAQKAGNLLWMSVGEGMLAQTEEMQGQGDEAQRLRASGTLHANEAFMTPDRK